MKLNISFFNLTQLAATAFLTAAIFSFHPVSGQVIVGGTLTQNTTYSKQFNPYIVSQNLIVPPGITLTIGPGTILLFSSNTSLTVQGELHAFGNVNDSIRFKLDTIPINQNPWYALIFDNAHTVLDPEGNYVSGTIVSYATISKASYSVIISGFSGILLEHCKIQESAYGIYMNDAENNMIRNCTISKTGYGIFLPSGITARNNTFKDNDIHDNFTVGFLINNNDSRVQHNLIYGNRVSNNYIGLYIGNNGLADIGLNVISDNVIKNNILEGVRIYQDSSYFSGNFVVDNGTGLNLSHSRASTIRENFFSGNTNWACVIRDSSCLITIDNNNICNNGGGIRVTSGDARPSLNNSFHHNLLYRNGSSFLLESAPQGLIQYNNIFLNGDLNSFVNLTPKLIHAEYNWWGTTIEPQIDSIIFDLLDNDTLGLVQYKTILSGPDTQAPISAPRNVIKRQVGTDVLLTWDPVPDIDLRGYHMHYGKFNGFSFETTLDAGNTTSMILPSRSVIDSVAISALDMDADGINDQPEGHESEFVFALLSPYAGPDTTICVNTPIIIDKATAFNYESITWTTSGDGTFVGAHSIRPTYNPGPNDNALQQVTLTFNVTGLTYNLSDETTIHFSKFPVLFAGNDTIIDMDTVFVTSLAHVENIERIRWVSSGDGYFENDTVLAAIYHPGQLDKNQGSSTLTLNTESVCGIVTDEVIVNLVQSFSLYGRIHAGNQLALGSKLSLFRISDNKVKPFRAAITSPDGKFTFGHVTPGNYYIYGVPDRDNTPGYAPAYYYDNLHWSDAYVLPVAKSTYDIDINLIKIAQDLPQGEGMISGTCLASASNNESCGAIAVMLFDKSAKYLLNWTWVNDDGTFGFNNLPYGNYLLVGEKAGYERFFSQVISITSDQPAIQNVILHVESFKISFILPPGTSTVHQLINVYPNPVGNKLYFEMLPHPGNYRVLLTASNGKVVSFSITSKAGTPAFLSTDNLPSGLYLLDIWDETSSLQKIKIIKN